MQDVLISVPDERKIQADLLPLAARAEGLVVTNQDEHGYAERYLIEIAQCERAVQNLFEDPKQAAFRAHRSICDAEHKLLDPLKKAKQLVARACGVYEQAERDRAMAEQRRLQDEARKQAEAQALAEAENAEKAGDPELAQQIVEDAAVAPPPPVYVPPKIATTAGVGSRTVWHAEVTNMHALIKHVAANPHLVNLLEPNMAAINGQVRSLRGALNLPGVRAVSDIQKTTRAA